MSAELFGFDVQLYDRAGRLLGAFGIEPGENRELASFARFRALSASADGGFWSAPRNAYVLTLRDAGGDVRRVLRRSVSWFPPWDGWDSSYDVAPPPPRLMAVHEDRQRRLWTLSLVPAPSWSRSNTKRAAGGEAPTAGVEELLRSNESIIEVIEIETGRLIISRQFPKLILRILPGGLVMELAQNDDGQVAVQISRLRLLDPR
jgi:hypothetical protein